MKTCPTCGQMIPETDYDPTDPIQRQGRADALWNIAHGSFGNYRNNTYPKGSSEYYRWNRGWHQAQSEKTPESRGQKGEG